MKQYQKVSLEEDIQKKINSHAFKDDLQFIEDYDVGICFGEDEEGDSDEWEEVTYEQWIQNRKPLQKKTK